MSINIEETTTITRQLVPENQRLSVIEKLFGTHFPVRLEPTIYGITEEMAEGYSGGLWNFYRLSNGGFDMAPEADEHYNVHCANYWQGKLSADALGIVACSYCYSFRSFSRDVEFARLCAQHYHWLREFMFDHSEVGSILEAID